MSEETPLGHRRKRRSLDRIKCPNCLENGDTHARAYLTEYEDYWCPSCHQYTDAPEQTTLELWGHKI